MGIDAHSSFNPITTACTASHECRSFVINPAGTQCNLYKGNPGDGNTRSFLAYVEAQGFTLYVAVSGNKQGLPINGVGE